MSAGEESKWVDILINGKETKLFADTGSRYTIIPPESYRREMGEIEAADTRLRAWGAKAFLDVKGMFKAELET